MFISEIFFFSLFRALFEKNSHIYIGINSTFMSKVVTFRCERFPQNLLQVAYLPGTEANCDHEGSSSRARPFHCTSVGLTPTITPNVGNSSA